VVPWVCPNRERQFSRTERSHERANRLRPRRPPEQAAAVGDLARDTAVEPRGGGRFEAELRRDWEIWGPMGGYVAACALRAVGASTAHLRPAAFSCHYLSVAHFGPVDIRVETRREGRSASSSRVEMTQGDRPILDAMVWSAAEVDGLEHDETHPPDVPGPDELPEISELVPAGTESPFPFWTNFEAKPLDFEDPWPPDGPRPASWRNWLRFLPTATFEDPWVDAARCVILVDLPSWPAAVRPHAWRQPSFTAPTLDLNVAFHQPTGGHEWLLCEGSAPLSTGGLFGWTARVWSGGGRLHASGGGQCLFRRLPTSG
jgi:acyl-CoA thioesterase II